MNIEEKLNEIGKYFRNKVIAGDYEFLSCDEHLAYIRIDGKYDFMLWIHNSIEQNFDFYTYSEKRLFEHICITDENERILAWHKLKPLVDRYITEKLIKEKEQELINLQKKLS